MLINQNRLNLLKLSAFPSFGPSRIKRIEKYFPCLENFFSANFNNLKRIGLDEETAGNFIVWRKTYSLNILLQQLEKEDISFLSWHDKDYPKLLLETDDPPPIIFYRGDISLLNSGKLFLAIVGARKNTDYGEKIVNELIPKLIKHDFKIISGLAFGIDSLAHKMTLAESGITIAVLGSGLAYNRIYPARHRLLAQEIIKNNGLVLSEFLPDTPALKNNFPRRNRIISGLSQGVLVVEAQEKSGSLITADHAMRQNRDVLAVPGNIFLKSSAGTNILIKKGARLVTNVTDILDNFNIEMVNNSKQPTLFTPQKYQPQNSLEQTIYNLIAAANSRGESISTDEIIKKTKLDTSTINSTLSILEIAGAIKNLDGCFIPHL